MTADIKMMMELRDLQVARDVAQKAKLGWFNSEFSVFGCSYMLNNTCYYRISTKAEDIYDLIEQSAQKEIFPTNVINLTKSCPVPVGLKDYIELEFKHELAKHLQRLFSKDFFHYLETIANLASDDCGETILCQIQEKIVGRFDEELLDDFSCIVNYIFNCRKITSSQYCYFINWIKAERSCMEENILCKDIFEKTFYGIAYQAGETIKYYENAYKSSIYHKKYQLEQQGTFVSPIYSHTYWYNHSLRLSDIRKNFQNKLHTQISPDKFYKLEHLCNHNTKISSAEFNSYANEVEKKYGQTAKETFNHYGHKWGII